MIDSTDTALSTIQERFERLLKYRGIKIISKSEEQLPEERQVSSRRLRSYNLFPSSDEEAPADEDAHSERHDFGIFDVDNLDIDMNDERVIDYFGLSRIEENPDADEFYDERRESFSSWEFEDTEIGIEDNDEQPLSGDYKDIKFVAYDNSKDSKDSEDVFTNKSEDFGLNSNTKLPSDNEIAYTQWEVHDPITKREIMPSIENNDSYDNDEDDDDDIMDDGKDRKSEQYDTAVIDNEKMGTKDGRQNGGLYDPFRPEFTLIENTDNAKLVSLSPASKYRDLIKLNSLGIKKLANLESVRKYKNNLSSIISDSRGDDYLITSSNSELIIFAFDPISQLPQRNPILRFDTKPIFTSTTDRLISTWPYFPHTINFLKVTNWLGKQILGVCLDDGMLMIWYSETIIEQIKKKRQNNNNLDIDDETYVDNNRFYGIKINPDHKLKMEASLWGLDFLSYKDDVGNDHNLIIASDNSQSITLFYYHTRDERFYHIKSHQILHNIPEVTFVSSSLKNDVHSIKVSCASISGELVIFKFNFTLNAGPLDKDEYEFFKDEPIYYVDSTMAQIENRRGNRQEDEDAIEAALKLKRFHRVVFNSPNVITRVLLGEDCWTCKPIMSTSFKLVQSIRAMTGDPNIDEKKEIRRILHESNILDSLCDPVKTSLLGYATYWQFYESSTLNLAGSSREPNDTLETARLTGIDDDCRRIYKGIDRRYRSLENTSTKQISLNGKPYWPMDKEPGLLLAVSTSKRLGLFRADSLYCNAATKRLFDLSIPFNDESKFSNRISITHLIPELLCLIVVTQQGLVTIMRLCQHRGLFGMRQEHIFPNALSMALGCHGYRTIAGLAIRNMSLSHHPRYFIYITYTDGIIVSYELTINDLQDLMLLAL